MRERERRCYFHRSFATASHLTHGASPSNTNWVRARRTRFCAVKDRIVGGRRVVVHIGYWTHVLMAVRACLISRCEDRPSERSTSSVPSLLPSFLELIVLAPPLPPPPKLLRPRPPSAKARSLSLSLSLATEGTCRARAKMRSGRATISANLRSR